VKVFVSGGSKSGKSAFALKTAQKLRRPDAPFYYLATMIPSDKEDEERVARHKREREGLGCVTVEAGRDVSAAAEGLDPRGLFLLDSVTALLANTMFTPDGNVNMQAHVKIADDLALLAEKAANIVIVSDYIYSDARLYGKTTESFRSGLAHIDRTMAGVCDAVAEAHAGLVAFHKGGGAIDGLD